MTDDAPHDFDHQRAETALTVRDLISETPLEGGERIVLDLLFVPGDAPDTEGLLRKLKAFGYQGAPDETGIAISVPDVTFDADAIWLHEERTTRLALIHGFVPDGWGFAEP